MLKLLIFSAVLQIQGPESAFLLALINAVMSGGMLLAFIATLVRLGRLLERIDNQAREILSQQAQLDEIWKEIRSIPGPRRR